MKHQGNNYNEFLFYSIIKDTDCKHPLKIMEYDRAFDRLEHYYEEFYKSPHFDLEGSEYDTIVSFLKAEYTF